MNSFDSARLDAQKQLDEVQQKRAELETILGDYSIKISKLETLIAGLTELIGDSQKDVQAHIGQNGATIKVAHEATLSGIPRQGYGVITKAVAALLEAEPGGISARDLTDALRTAGFHLNGPDEEMTVRSALKNLRKSGRAIYDSPTSRYRAPKKQPAVAAAGYS